MKVTEMMALTLMPSGPSSRASDAVTLVSAYLLMA